MQACNQNRPLRYFLVFLLATTLSTAVFLRSTSSSSIVFIDSYGQINYLPSVYVTADFASPLSVNNLSLGVNVGNDFDFSKWRNDPAFYQKASACNFRLIRLFLHEIQPCTFWNENQHIGQYSWDLFDRTIERVLEVGAEPLLVIASGNSETKYWLPTGMEGNNQGSRFPSNASFGAFCADIVSHCNIVKNWNIRFWEIWNEPTFYDSNDATGIVNIDLDRIGNFTKTFNNAAQLMISVDPSVLCGHGFSGIQTFFDYFAVNSKGLGFFSIHDYDASATRYCRPESYKEENEVMADASAIGYQKPGIWKTYTPEELRQKWYDKRGQQLPVLITETCMNSAYINGTDPRIQTVFGAAWYAEKLRSASLAGILFSSYFVLASDDSLFSKTTGTTGGYGFGMINSTSPYNPWFPYYTNLLLGQHLQKGDTIVSSSTSNFTIASTLAWIDGNHHYNVLIVGKTANSALVSVNVRNSSVTNGTQFLMQRIDKDHIYEQSNCSFASQISIPLNGYSVILLEIS